MDTGNAVKFATRPGVASGARQPIQSTCTVDGPFAANFSQVDAHQRTYWTVRSPADADEP